MIKRVIAVIVALSLALPYFCLSGYAIDYVSGNVANKDMQVRYRYRYRELPADTTNKWSGYINVPVNDAGISFVSDPSATIPSCYSFDAVWLYLTPTQSIFEAGKKYRIYLDTTFRMCRYNGESMVNISEELYNNVDLTTTGFDGADLNASFKGNFYRRATGFIINGTFTPQYETSGPIRIVVSLSPSWVRPDDYGRQPYFSFDLSDIILGTTGSSSVDAVNGYIEDAAAEISSSIAASAADIQSSLMQIYRYMTGDQNAILEAIRDNALLIYTLLNNNMLPAIINGFASLEGVVEDGFADTALEIQAQTAQLILTLNNAFNHLEGVISGESDDIQAAIAAQTEAILAYLEDAFTAANDPALSEGAQQGSAALEGNEAIEGELQESLDSNVGNIDFTSYALPAGIFNAVLWISNTFTGFFNELGDMQIVLTLPLVVGLILLMIGRGSRAIISAAMRGSRRGPDA